MCKCLRVNQILCYKFMQPFNSFFIAFLNSCVNNFPFIRYSKMISRVSITFSKSIDQNCRILISIIDDKRHRDHITFH